MFGHAFKVFSPAPETEIRSSAFYDAQGQIGDHDFVNPKVDRWKYPPDRRAPRNRTLIHADSHLKSINYRGHNLVTVVVDARRQAMGRAATPGHIHVEGGGSCPVVHPGPKVQKRS